MGVSLSHCIADGRMSKSELLRAENCTCFSYIWVLIFATESFFFFPSTTSDDMVLYVSLMHIGIITQFISPVETNSYTSDHNWLQCSLFCTLANEMNVLFWNQITGIQILSMMFCFTQVLSSKCKYLVISEGETCYVAPLFRWNQITLQLSGNCLSLMQLWIFQIVLKCRRRR